MAKRVGFTTVELVVTVVVCAITFLLVAVWFEWDRTVHARSVCLNNLKQIGLSLRLYNGNGREIFPQDPKGTTVGSFSLLTNNYQTSYVTWICPSDVGVHPGGPTKPFGSSNVSYAYGAFGLTEGTQPDTPIVADRTTGDITSANPWITNTVTHRSAGGNVLYVDGHVAFTKTVDPPMYRGKNP